MKFKKILKYLFPLVGLILIFTYFSIQGEKIRKRFFENSINDIIIDSCDSQKRVIEYYFKSDIRIDISVLDSVDLKVGDSISKEALSYEFKIYRKKNRKYEFYKDYDIGSRYN